MKTTRILLMVLAAWLATSATAQTNLTASGNTYTNAMFLRTTAYAVVLRHSTGIATIPLAELPPELQSRFGYDPAKASAYRQRDLAASEQQRSEDEQRSRTASVKQAQENAATSAQISRAHAQLTAINSNSEAALDYSLGVHVATGSAMKHGGSTPGDMPSTVKVQLQ